MRDRNKITISQKSPSSTELLLQAVFNNTPLYQVLLNQELEIMLFNKCAAEFTLDVLGVEPIIGERITKHISPTFALDFEHLCLLALKGENVSYEHFIRRNNTEGTWFNFNIAAIYNAHKEVIGLTIVGSSTTEIKRQEKKIKHQSKTLSFIAQLQSHQIRQPVSSILGLMNLIKEENYHPKKEYLEGLEVATKQLDTIIKRIVCESRNV